MVLLDSLRALLFLFVILPWLLVGSLIEELLGAPF